MSHLSQFRGPNRDSLTIRGRPVSQSLYHPPQLPHPDVRSSPTPEVGAVSLLERYMQTAQELLPSLPSLHRRLGPEDVTLIGEHPTAAGGLANIWDGMHNGRKVVLKSYRCYMSLDPAQVFAVRCNHSLCRADC